MFVAPQVLRMFMTQHTGTQSPSLDNNDNCYLMILIRFYLLLIPGSIISWLFHFGTLQFEHTVCVIYLFVRIRCNIK